MLQTASGASTPLEEEGRSQRTLARLADEYVPTPLSLQVRALRKGGDAHEGVKDNVLIAFGKLMARLDAVYAKSAARAPVGFEERIHFWHHECSMPSALKDGLHRLHVWANAARHRDDARWRRDGPPSGEEASHRITTVEHAIEELEG